ncbi:amidoligase family protein, partial [Corallococcus sp. 4LFB]|uniref:amidoligase family protein n=1 Tax=Corallococcus sp. 4LFB TaxID=3383249 RepID=UPI003975861A
MAHAIQGAVGGHVSGDYRGWQVTDPQGRAWKVVPDGSLSGGDYSGEIVSPILTYQDLDALQHVVRAAREAGARADASTGIHIHVDGSRFDAKGVTNLVKMVHKQERLLETALGVSAA